MCCDQRWLARFVGEVLSARAALRDDGADAALLGLDSHLDSLDTDEDLNVVG